MKSSYVWQSCPCHFCSFFLQIHTNQTNVLTNFEACWLYRKKHYVVFMEMGCESLQKKHQRVLIFFYQSNFFYYHYLFFFGSDSSNWKSRPLCGSFRRAAPFVEHLQNKKYLLSRYKRKRSKDFFTYGCFCHTGVMFEQY